MNRAVRRQQLKDKPDDDKPTRKSAMPRISPSAKGQTAAPRKGVAGLTPRWAGDIVSELRKVVWPKREDVMHLTVVIVIVTILIGAALGLIDISFSWLIDKTLLGN